MPIHVRLSFSNAPFSGLFDDPKPASHNSHGKINNLVSEKVVDFEKIVNAVVYDTSLYKNNGYLQNVSPIKEADGTAVSFNGLIDNLVIDSAIELVDVEQIRVAILDLSAAQSVDTPRNYDRLLEFDSVRSRFMKSQTLVHWTGITDLLGSFFTVVSSAALPIHEGVAEGILTGVEGLNLVTVAALKKEIVRYYGESFVVAQKGNLNEVDVTLYKL